MKLIQPEFSDINNRYKEKLRKGDSEGGRRVMEERSTLLKKYNVNLAAAAVNLLQLPVYICWFIGMRDVVYTPEKFGFMDSSEFFWVPSLFTPDPYFLLPFISATITFFTIKKTMKRAPITAETPLMFKKLRIYAPYLPFPGAIFLATFPAGLNLYFLALSISNFATTSIMSSQIYLKTLGIPKAFPGTILYNNLMSEAQITDVKKAVIIDTPAVSTTHAKETAEAPISKAPVQNTQSVKVFTNKPKSKKK